MWASLNLLHGPYSAANHFVVGLGSYFWTPKPFSGVQNPFCFRGTPKWISMFLLLFIQEPQKRRLGVAPPPKKKTNKNVPPPPRPPQKKEGSNATRSSPGSRKQRPKNPTAHRDWRPSPPWARAPRACAGGPPPGPWACRAAGTRCRSLRMASSLLIYEYSYIYIYTNIYIYT